MTNLIKRLDHPHFFQPALAINCAKSLVMSRHASMRKNEVFPDQLPAPVISIHIASGKKDKQHGTGVSRKSAKELPLHYTEPIFKAKKHDPL